MFEFMIVLVCLVYFVPVWVALKLRSGHMGMIFMITLVLGVTGIGWIVALWLALKYKHQDNRYPVMRRAH